MFVLGVFAVVLLLLQNALSNVYAVDFGREYFKVGVASADAARKGNPIDMVLNEESKRKTPSSIAVEFDGITYVGANAIAHAKRKPEASLTGFPWLIGDECPAGCVQDEGSLEYICKIHDTEVTQSEIVGYVADYITSILPLQSPAPAIAVVPPYASIAASTSLITSLNDAQDILDFSDTVTTMAGAAASYVMSAVRGQKDVAKEVIVVDSGGWETCVGSVFIYSSDKNKAGKDNPPSSRQFTLKDGPSKCLELSGKQVDEAVARLIVANSPVEVDGRTLQGDAQKCKMTLSANDFCVVHMDDQATGKHVTFRVTRSELVNELKTSGVVTEGVMGNIIHNIVLKSLNKKLGQVPVIFVGGNTRVPRIKEYLTAEVEFVNKLLAKQDADLTIYGGVNNDEGIVLGATIIGATQHYNSRVKIYYKMQYNAADQLFPMEHASSNPFIGIARMEQSELATLEEITKEKDTGKMDKETIAAKVHSVLNTSKNPVKAVFDDDVGCPAQKTVSLMVRPEDTKADGDVTKVMFKLGDFILEEGGADENVAEGVDRHKLVGGAFSVCRIRIPKAAFSADEGSEEAKDEGADKETSPKQETTETVETNAKADVTANIAEGTEFKVSFDMNLSSSCLPLLTREGVLYKKTPSSTEWKQVKEHIPISCSNYSFNDRIKKQDNISFFGRSGTKKADRPVFLMNPAPGPNKMGNYKLNIKLNTKVREIADLANEMMDELTQLYTTVEAVDKWNKLVKTLKSGYGGKDVGDVTVSVLRTLGHKEIDEMIAETTGLYDFYTTLVGRPLRCEQYEKEARAERETNREGENEEDSKAADHEQQQESVTNGAETAEAKPRIEVLKDSMPCLARMLKDIQDGKRRRNNRVQRTLTTLTNFKDRDEHEQKTIELLGKLRLSVEKIINDNLVVEHVCIDPEQALKSALAEEEEGDGLFAGVRPTFWQKLFIRGNKTSKEEKAKLKEKFEKEFKQCQNRNNDVTEFIKQRDSFYQKLKEELEKLDEQKKEEMNFEGKDEEFVMKFTIDSLQDLVDNMDKSMKRLISKYRSLKP